MHDDEIQIVFTSGQIINVKRHNDVLDKFRYVFDRYCWTFETNWPPSSVASGHTGLNSLLTVTK